LTSGPGLKNKIWKIEFKLSLNGFDSRLPSEDPKNSNKIWFSRTGNEEQLFLLELLQI
jgi:hypothetical protein